MMLAQVAVRSSGPAQIVSTTSVVVNAAIAATVKRPEADAELAARLLGQCVAEPVGYQSH